MEDPFRPQHPQRSPPPVLTIVGSCGLTSESRAGPGLFPDPTGTQGPVPGLVPDAVRLRSFGAPYSQQESNCRIEELTRALGRSTRITPVRFAWLSPANLCAEMLGKAGRSTAPLLIGTNVIPFQFHPLEPPRCPLRVSGWRFSDSPRQSRDEAPPPPVHPPLPPGCRSRIRGGPQLSALLPQTLNP